MTKKAAAESQAEKKKDWKRYKVVSKPEGEATFVDPVTGVTREYIRITEGKFASEKEAKRIVEFSNWDVHVEHDEPLYEIVSVELVD